MRTLLRLLAAAALLLTAVVSRATSAAALPSDGPGHGSPWVVAVGDSYISGEGGRWAGNSNKLESYVDAGGPATYFDNAEHSAETIARCHRSTSAEVYLGNGVNGLDLACSGAMASTLTSDSDGNFKPGLDFYDGAQGQGQALMLQRFAQTHNVTSVTVSIGGNDFNFGSIVTQCVSDFLLSTFLRSYYCSSDQKVTDAISSSNVATVTKRIATAFQNIRLAMRNGGYSDSSWTLIVQNYPTPIPNSAAFRYGQSGYGRQSTGGCGLWNKDADYANNTLLPTINNAVSDAATQSGLTNVRFLDVSGAFNGRRLCETGVNLVESSGLADWRAPGASDKSEWVNQIRTVSTTGTNYFVQESLHPNYWGQLALRNCLRLAYNNGVARSGTCTHGTGLNSAGEPNMSLSTTDAAGTVTGSDGAPIVGACVYLYLTAQSPNASYASCAADGGRFQISGVTPGQYVVAVADPAGRYQTIWTPSPLKVDGSTALTLTMPPTTTGALTGTVSAPAGTAPCVFLYRRSDPSAAAYATCTDGQGSYAFYGVAAGAYDVAFSDPSGAFRTQWWTGAAPASATESAAVPVVVQPGATATADATLSSPVRVVTGTVTDAGGPVAGACVYLYPTDGSASSAAAASCTGSDGSYWIGDVPAGAGFKLAVSDPSGAHTTQWWTGSADGAASMDGGARLPATAGGKFTADVQLPLRASGGVAGTLTSSSGAPAAGSCVYLYPAGGSTAASFATCAQGDGAYWLDGVAPGDYQVAFFDPSGGDQTQWWTGGAGGTSSQAASVPVSVGRSIVTGIDATMSEVTR